MGNISSDIAVVTRHFISLEPAFWATLPLYSTLACTCSSTVGGSKEGLIDKCMKSSSHRSPPYCRPSGPQDQKRPSNHRISRPS